MVDFHRPSHILAMTGNLKSLIYPLTSSTVLNVLNILVILKKHVAMNKVVTLWMWNVRKKVKQFHIIQMNVK